MKFIQKCATLYATIFALCITTTVSSLSAVAQTNDDVVEVNSKDVNYYISEAALEWADGMAPNIELSAGEIKELVDLSSDNVSYCVSFFHNSLPYGYAVVVNQDNDLLVSEGCIGANEDDIATKLADNIEENNEKKGIECEVSTETIYRAAPLEYFAEVEKDDEVVLENAYGDIYDPDSWGADSYNNGSSIFIEAKNWKNANYKVDASNSQYLQKFRTKSKLLPDEYTKNISKKYACAVQSLMQISYMEGIINYNTTDTSTNHDVIKKTYKELWSKTYTKKISENADSVIFGETHISFACSGFVNFAKEYGYKNTTYERKSSPSTSWLKTQMKNNKPVLIQYKITLNDGSSVGHFVSLLGVVRATKVSSGKTYNYLKVYDGFNSRASYINYTTVDFKTCNAAAFNVKK